MSLYSILLKAILGTKHLKLHIIGTHGKWECVWGSILRWVKGGKPFSGICKVQLLQHISLYQLQSLQHFWLWQVTVTAILLTVAITVTATLLTVAITVTGTLLTVASYSQCDTFDCGKLQSLQYFSLWQFTVNISEKTFTVARYSQLFLQSSYSQMYNFFTVARYSQLYLQSSYSQIFKISPVAGTVSRRWGIPSLWSRWRATSSSGQTLPMSSGQNAANELIRWVNNTHRELAKKEKLAVTNDYMGMLKMSGYR